MFDAKFLEELAETKVAEKGDYLKPGDRAGTVILLDCEEKDTDMSGRAVFLNFKLLSVANGEAPGEDQRTSAPGQILSKSFFINDGNKKKRDAMRGDLIRSGCAVYSSLADDTVTARQVTGNAKRMGEVLAALKECKGVVCEFAARDSETDNGDFRTYHDLKPVKQTVEEVKKRRELLAKNAPVAAFL